MSLIRDRQFCITEDKVVPVKSKYEGIARILERWLNRRCKEAPGFKTMSVSPPVLQVLR